MKHTFIQDDRKPSLGDWYGEVWRKSTDCVKLYFRNKCGLSHPQKL